MSNEETEETETEQTIRIGSVVELRSGSPDMVVTNIENGSDGVRLHTAWFSEGCDGGEVRTARFPTEAVELVEE